MTLESTKKCRHCGKAFQPKARADQSYCDRKCRRAARYERTKSKPKGVTITRAQPVKKNYAGVDSDNPVESAQDAVCYLTDGLHKLGKELDLPDVVRKIELAADTFVEAFNLVDECLILTEPVIQARKH